MPASHLRPQLARDGIFNLRDLGGSPVDDGRVLRRGMLVRADALQRSSGSTVRALHVHGIRRVLDLRDDSERDLSGAFTVVDDLDQLIAGTEAGTRYCLVWISLDPTYGHLVTLDELGDLVTLRPLASGTHVDVYEVTAR